MSEWQMIQKNLRDVHPAAHRAYRHKPSGRHLILVYYGFGACNPPKWSWWLIGEKDPKGRYREHMASPDAPPFGWAVSLIGVA